MLAGGGGRGGGGVVEADVSVAAFIAACCDVGGGRRVHAAELRTAFMSWAIDLGKLDGFPTPDEFAVELLRAVDGLFAFHDPDQLRTWGGVALKPSAAEKHGTRRFVQRPEPASDSADAKGCANGGAP